MQQGGEAGHGGHVRKGDAQGEGAWEQGEGGQGQEDGGGFIKIKRPLNLIYGLCINTLSRNSVLTNKAGPPHKMSQFGAAFENVVNAFLLGGAK